MLKKITRCFCGNSGRSFIFGGTGRQGRCAAFFAARAARALRQMLRPDRRQTKTPCPGGTAPPDQSARPAPGSERDAQGTPRRIFWQAVRPPRGATGGPAAGPPAQQDEHPGTGQCAGDLTVPGLCQHGPRQQQRGPEYYRVRPASVKNVMPNRNSGICTATSRASQPSRCTGMQTASVSAQVSHGFCAAPAAKAGTAGIKTGCCRGTIRPHRQSLFRPSPRQRQSCRAPEASAPA